MSADRRYVVRPEHRPLVVTLALAGHPHQTIAEVFGSSPRTIANIVRDAVETARDQREAHRRLERLLDPLAN